MAVPSIPARLYSYTNHSVTQPDQPHDGDKLDAEFNQLIATDTALLAFMRQAIEDDGTIKLAAISAHLASVTTGPQGPQGDPGTDGADGADGQSYVPDAIGVTADRTQYNAEIQGFAFLDTEAGLLYWKLSNTVADWSTGVAFGQGPAGPAGATGPAGPTGATGATGAAGTNGADGAQGPQGTPGMVPRGAWDNATAYITGDIVTVGGTAVYVALQDHTGRDPATETLFWTKILDNDALVSSILPDGPTGTFTRPRMTTTARDALDMTSKAAGYEIYNTTTGQVEAWDGTSVWGAVSSGLHGSGDFAEFVGRWDLPAGWTNEVFHERISTETIPVLSQVDTNYGSYALLTNNKILYVNAQNTGTYADAGWLYDIATNTFSTIAEPPARRYRPQMIALPSGKALMICGSSDSGYINFTQNVYEYDSVANSWTTWASLPAKRIGYGCILSSDETEVFVVGGYTDHTWSSRPGTIYRGNLSTRTWSTASSTTTQTGTQYGPGHSSYGVPLNLHSDGRVIIWYRYYTGSAWEGRVDIWTPSTDSISNVASGSTAYDSDPRGMFYAPSPISAICYVGNGPRYYDEADDTVKTYIGMTATVLRHASINGRNPGSLAADFGYYRPTGQWLDRTFISQIAKKD